MRRLRREVTERTVTIYMTGVLCTQPAQLLASPQAPRVIQVYLNRLLRRGSERLALLGDLDLAGTVDEPSPAARRLAHVLALLCDLSPEEIAVRAPDVAPLLADRAALAELVEDLYNHWRSFERYLIFEGGADESRDRALEGHMPFIENTRNLSTLARQAYRRIEFHLRGHWPRVYRQVPAGANMGLLIDQVRWPIPPGPYQNLREIRFVRLALLELPLILRPRRNFRKGRFVRIARNPLEGLTFDPDRWLCIPLCVGELGVLVFFDVEYLSLATSLVNLFELAGHAEARRRPDAILIFGVPGPTDWGELTAFYVDEENDLVVGAVEKSEDVDYFGYFKKMILTLHNVIMMRRGRLPLHGAMARVRLRDGPTAGIVLVGDSAAGKSETLDAFQSLAADWISDMTIIFDDMGSLAIAPDGSLVAYGTEIGAFVRLDDLDPAYAFGHLDRSILMNPERHNARVVLPITDYKHVISGCRVDMLLYANNYEGVSDEVPPLELFPNPEQALSVFRAGYRAAKGTTDEKGLVSSYFANPFGPSQMKELHEELAQRYFRAAFDAGVLVGQLRTRLAIDGFEREGPRQAAEWLFRYLRERFHSPA